MENKKIEAGKIKHFYINHTEGIDIVLLDEKIPALCWDLRIATVAFQVSHWWPPFDDNEDKLTNHLSDKDDWSIGEIPIDQNNEVLSLDPIISGISLWEVPQVKKRNPFVMMGKLGLLR
jgi:hypothetical protein